jgi:ADP-ribosylglycohydrolase
MGAVEDAAILCRPTHNTNVAISGASAVAAAIATALRTECSILDVLDAAVQGAAEGERLGRRSAAVVAAPSVVERIRLAAAIAVQEDDLDAAAERLAAVIGSGLPVAEAVPTALGLFLAARGDPNRAVIAAVNLGGDTDTIGTIVGAISGAYAGYEALNQDLATQVLRANEIDMETRVKKLTVLAQRSLDESE